MYRALYRKWRPDTFDEVYGQEHIVKTLKREVESGKLSHAYIFTGSRGTGKTSCAKILAKAVNCLHPVNGNPCNECEICRGIDDGSLTDIVEMDAASNNSVDDIRELREEVLYAPVAAKYRVYIIDEVHMLSSSAYNALLKTLEEPPAHVIFILATTDIHKVIPTIQSRCQRFDFKRLSADKIVRRLQFIADKENVTLTDRAAHFIANISDGGMRDALSLLDRCLSLTDSIDEKIVSEAAGAASIEKLFEFSDYVASCDFSSAVSLISDLYGEYCDITNLCSGLLNHYRNLMIAKAINNCSGLIICSEDELKQFRASSEKYSMNKILECIDIILKASDSLKFASNKKIILEAAVIRMCSLADKYSAPVYAEENSRIEALENKLNELISLVSAGGTIAAPEKEEEAPTEVSVPEPVKEELPEKDEAPEPVVPSFNKKTEEKPEPEEEEEAGTDETETDEQDDEPIPGQVPWPGAEEAEEEKEEEPAPQPEVKAPEVPEVPAAPAQDTPFMLWPEIIEKIMKYNMPLYSVLVSTTAILRNGKIIIMTDNPTLKAFIVNNNYAQDLKRAIIEVTGKEMKAAISIVGEKSKQENKPNTPLDTLKNKINELKEQET